MLFCLPIHLRDFIIILQRSNATRAQFQNCRLCFQANTNGNHCKVKLCRLHVCRIVKNCSSPYLSTGINFLFKLLPSTRQRKREEHYISIAFDHWEHEPHKEIFFYDILWILFYFNSEKEKSIRKYPALCWIYLWSFQSFARGFLFLYCFKSQSMQQNTKWSPESYWKSPPGSRLSILAWNKYHLSRRSSSICSVKSYTWCSR